MHISRTNRIILQKPTFQGITLQIPVADISYALPGPTILITGGMDGDEYTGIRAAYELIEYYSSHPLKGRIIILPIVNIPGFYDGKSLNPLDGKYPKYIFPGNKKGSVTEQLIDWLNINYIEGADLWIDLHSGAISERLQPFIWGFETKNKKLNETTKSILQALDSKIIVYEKAPFLSKAARLASKNCIYLVFERGEKGDQNIEEIIKMTEWVKKTIDIAHGKKTKVKNVKVFTKVVYYRALFDGMWIPSVEPERLAKGTIAGIIKTLDGKKEERITVKQSGEVLWMKSALPAKKGDELVVVAILK